MSRILQDHFGGGFASNAFDHRLFLLIRELAPIAAAGFGPPVDVIAHFLLAGAKAAFVALLATDGCQHDAKNTIPPRLPMVSHDVTGHLPAIASPDRYNLRSTLSFA